MAYEPALLVRQRVGAAVAEVTTGTPVALTAAEAAFNMFNPAMRATIPNFAREGQSSLSQLASVPGARMGEMEFETELFNSGTATNPTWATVLLLAAGFSGSGGAYTPVTGSASYVSLTLGLFTDGRLKTIAGSVGDLTISGKAGQPVRSKWKFQGVWQPPSATALVAPTYPTVIPPRFAGSTVTIGGATYKVTEFSLSMGNVIAMRENGGHVSAYHSAVITDRKPTLRVTIEANPFGTYDPYAVHLAGTEVAFSLALGSGSNGVVTIAAPKAQLTQPPEDGDNNGVLLDVLTFQLNRGSTGDDELSITLT
jgi:hypothetical protein